MRACHIVYGYFPFDPRVRREAEPLRLMGTRVILDLHEAMPEILAARFNLSLRSLAVRLARVLEWLSCAFADAVVAQNETIRDLLAARGVKASKLVVVMNSPDPSKLLPERADRLRAELGISKNPAIVYVGGINPERDLGLLVLAVARLRASYPINLLQ